MKGRAASSRIPTWLANTREQRAAAMVAITWVVLSAGFVGFMLILTAIQHG